MHPYEQRCGPGLLGQYLAGVGHWLGRGNGECLNSGCDPIYNQRDGRFTRQLDSFLPGRGDASKRTPQTSHTHIAYILCVWLFISQPMHQDDMEETELRI